MTTNRTHIIHQAQVEISSAAWMDTRTTQQWVQGKLLELLDEVLNEMSDDNTVQTIDKLQIQFHWHGLQDLNTSSTRQLMREHVKQALGSAANDKSLAKTLPDNHSFALNDLLWYLQQGSVAEKASITKWKQHFTRHGLLSAMDKQREEALLKTLQSPDAWHRFNELLADMDQLEEELVALLASHSPGLSQWHHWFLQAKSNAVFHSRQQRQQALFYLLKSSFVADTDVASFLQEKLAAFGIPPPRQEQAPLAALKNKPASTGTAIHANSAENEAADSLPAFADSANTPVYVANAGLILLAPFLPRFFQQLQLDPAQSTEAAQQACRMMHYLATGDTKANDWELTLPKLLCAIPFENAIANNAEIAEEWQTEADQLLSSVITHWSKLGNTSVAALRQSFLQRDGQLEFRKNGITLKIIERTEDILLQFIPWSFRLVKLPWMKQMLETAWT
jgi:hypothetical protein